MPRFLSSPWIDALAAALAEARVPTHEPFAPFTLRLIVGGGPHDGDGADGSGGYGVRISDDGLLVVRGTGGPEAAGDLVVTTDYVTAAALNRGELSAQEAIESGRLAVRGRLERVTGARKVLVALDDASRELRAATTYDPEP